MSENCKKKYSKVNIVFIASLQTGILDQIGSHLDVLPVWYCGASGECRLDVILYGVYLGGQGEWSPPQGIIYDAAGTPALTWLSTKGQIGSPPPWHDERESSKWQPFSNMGDSWFDARERVIGCCEQIGELFQRRGECISGEEIAFLHQMSIDYRQLLPPELFEQCKGLYPDFFYWLMKWL
jgi:hypothetical protein